MRVYFKDFSGKISPADPASGLKAKYLIWGDWLDVDPDPASAAHYIVNWKSFDARTSRVGVQHYRIERARCQDEALLEMIFLDVGQGDGCIVSVPDGNRQRTIIVDAGEGTNMHRFLKWKFRYTGASADFAAAVITHPDSDHYQGFQPLFDDSRIRFDTVYHNGLVERVSAARDDVLGPRQSGYCIQLFPDRAGLETFLSDPATRGSKRYPKLLWTALQSPARFADVRMAAVGMGDMGADGRTYLPGFAPGATDASIEILGPVPEAGPGGAPALPTFGAAPGDGGYDVGKTKNGHSVILKLQHGNLRVIFGGDLNRPAEDRLLRHYGGIAAGAPLGDAVQQARGRLGADLLKCCHHGSADVTDEFLDAVHPFAFVVSSGDEESHVHPRPEILGLLGKKGRGARPLILCTEILRSTPESRKLSAAEVAKQAELLDAERDAATPVERKAARQRLTDFFNERFRRLVNVYGAITIRSDGDRMMVAFRKEAVASGSPWQLYDYRFEAGQWVGKELKNKGSH